MFQKILEGTFICTPSFLVWACLTACVRAHARSLEFIATCLTLPSQPQVVSNVPYLNLLHLNLSYIYLTLKGNIDYLWCNRLKPQLKWTVFRLEWNMVSKAVDIKSSATGSSYQIAGQETEMAWGWVSSRIEASNWKTRSSACLEELRSWTLGSRAAELLQVKRGHICTSSNQGRDAVRQQGVPPWSRNGPKPNMSSRKTYIVALQ